MNPRIEILAAVIVARARTSDGGEFRGAVPSLPHFFRQNRKIEFTDEEFQEALALLVQLDCARLYHHEGVADYVLVHFEGLPRQFGIPTRPNRDPSIFTSLLGFSESVANSYSSRRRRSGYPLLASYADLGEDWLKEALSLLRPSADSSVRIEGVRADQLLIEPAKVADLTAQVAAASDRQVTFDHNQAEYQTAVAATEQAIIAIESSNTLDPSLRERLTTSLRNGLVLISQSGRISVAALNFLIIDRLKEAYKSAMEDALKTVIEAAIIAVALSILGVI